MWFIHWWNLFISKTKPNLEVLVMKKICYNWKCSMVVWQIFFFKSPSLWKNSHSILGWSNIVHNSTFHQLTLFSFKLQLPTQLMQKLEQCTFYKDILNCYHLMFKWWLGYGNIWIMFVLFWIDEIMVG